MKLVFYGDLGHPSASGHQRLWALKQCGVEIKIIDKSHYPSKYGKWGGGIAKVLRQPQFMVEASRLQKDLIDLCEEFAPHIIWLEWPREITASLASRLLQLQPRPFLISFQDDNPWGERHNDRWMWQNYFKLIPYLDLHLVKRPEDVSNLIALGAKACSFWEHGVYSPLFFPYASSKCYPVSFVGTCMDQRVELICYLLERGIPIHVFGSHWDRRSNLPQRFPLNFHPEIQGEAYAEVIRQSHICLGLVSHSNKDEWTMRTYEVPGCASLLLAERTPKHESLFIDNQEAIFFSTFSECAEKIQFLLTNLDQCKRIGEAAYKKSVIKAWAIEKRMQILVNNLEGVINL
jgi:spore maturation protein CgeB